MDARARWTWIAVALAALTCGTVWSVGMGLFLHDQFSDAGPGVGPGPEQRVTRVEIAVLCGALEEYASRNDGRYPDSLEELVRPDENGWTYLDGRTELPVDPWGNPFHYEPPAAVTAPR